MTTPHLSDDDVRDLFSDHLEGTLDKATAAAVDAALRDNAGLRAEQQAFARTMSLLRELPRPEVSSQLVSQVRARLAAGDTGVGGVVDNVIPFAPRQPAGPVAARSGWSMRVVAGFAAVAAVIAVVMVGVPGGTGTGGNADMLGAGLADEAVAVVWQAPGIDRAVITAAAAAAGMGTDGDAFVGDQRAAARFFVALKTSAAGIGSDVSGALPEHAERVVVTVATVAVAH